jgi:hypothetical protein
MTQEDGMVYDTFELRCNDPAMDTVPLQGMVSDDTVPLQGMVSDDTVSLQGMVSDDTVPLQGMVSDECPNVSLFACIAMFLRLCGVLSMALFSQTPRFDGTWLDVRQGTTRLTRQMYNQAG